MGFRYSLLSSKRMKSNYLLLMSHWKRAMTMGKREEAERLMLQIKEIVSSGKVTDREIETGKFIGWR